MQSDHHIKNILKRTYTSAETEMAYLRIKHMLENFKGHARRQGSQFSQKDAILITYGDSLLSKNLSPLQVLRDFCSPRLRSCFSAIHLLPFSPYSSDDGFSVKDYFSVNPELGDWRHIREIGSDFDLMFDFVLNHVSAQGSWFQNYLAEKDGFRDLAIETAPDTDLSKVVRPRALPLLTPFIKKSGQQVYLWTTFSSDQVDLNYRSIDVLLKMIEVLLFYVEGGARFLRLDAVAYLWKQVGTRCIHLPQTHDMVRLFRAVLDRVAPEVVIITETNVPHMENISYFGNGRNEAQMVYNFTLPPLLLHAFISEDSMIFSNWAQNLSTPSPQTAFFNFTASHDGIGVRPLEGLLSAEQIDHMVQTIQRNGGQVSSRRNRDDSESVYEMNITYVDALKNGCDAVSHAERFIASQAIQMVLPGIPGVYIHSLLGSHNWQAGVRKTGRVRSINRERLQAETVCAELDNPNSFRAKIFHPYCHLLRIRRNQPAFDPNAACRILPRHKQVVAVYRSHKEQQIFALTNICRRSVKWPSAGMPRLLRDLLTDRIVTASDLELKAFQSVWLTDP